MYLKLKILLFLRIILGILWVNVYYWLTGFYIFSVLQVINDVLHILSGRLPLLSQWTYKEEIFLLVYSFDGPWSVVLIAFVPVTRQQSFWDSISLWDSMDGGAEPLTIAGCEGGERGRNKYLTVTFKAMSSMTSRPVTKFCPLKAPCPSSTVRLETKSLTQPLRDRIQL